MNKSIPSPYINNITTPIPEDLFNQISKLLNENKFSAKELAFKVSIILMDARRRDKDSLIRELKILSSKLLYIDGSLDLSFINILIEKLKLN